MSNKEIKLKEKLLRAIAKNEGNVKYKSNIICKYNHPIGERFTRNGRCVTCLKHEKYTYYLNNKTPSKLYKYDIFSEYLESYYWIGFLLADGHFRRNGEIKLELSITDASHLKKFKTFTKSSNKIRKSKDGILTFSVFDSQHIPKLQEKFKITNNKTYQPPLIRTKSMTDEQFLALFIGFIDGDGCIHTKSNGQSSIIITLHQNWIFNLKCMEDNIKSIIKIAFNSKSKSKLIQAKNKTYASLSLHKIEILQYLKNFGIKHNLPVLKRKWNLIDEHKISRQKQQTQLYNTINPTILHLRDVEHKKFKEIAKTINIKFGLNFSENLIDQYYRRCKKSAVLPTDF